MAGRTEKSAYRQWTKTWLKAATQEGTSPCQLVIHCPQLFRSAPLPSPLTLLSFSLSHFSITYLLTLLVINHSLLSLPIQGKCPGLELKLSCWHLGLMTSGYLWLISAHPGQMSSLQLLKVKSLVKFHIVQIFINFWRVWGTIIKSSSCRFFFLICPTGASFL